MTNSIMTRIELILFCFGKKFQRPLRDNTWAALLLPTEAAQPVTKFGIILPMTHTETVLFHNFLLPS
jgi:hypothetical protein